MPHRHAARLWRHPEFRRGALDMAATSPGIAAWGLVTGVAMAHSGLPLPVVLAMTLLVFAGSAQLAVLPLLGAGAPLWVVWATALCVNLRFVIFSAQWRPHLVALTLPQRLRVAYFAGDMNYVLFMRRYPQPQPHDAAPLAYYWGGACTNWLAWQLPSLAGIALADRIPGHWGLGFAGTLALLGLGLSLLAGRATLVAAAVAGCAAVAAYALPLKLYIVVAIAAAVAAGLLLDWARGHAGPARGGAA